MEQNNYNSVHIMSEAVIVGGITMFFYKKISDLESTLEELKSHIAMQNNQIKFLLGSIAPQTGQMSVRGLTPHAEGSMLSFAQSPKLTTPLRLGQIQPQKEYFSNLSQHEPQEAKGTNGGGSSPYNCEGGVCKLVVPSKAEEAPTEGVKNHENEKKVVSISKISKQIEYDRENMDLDQTAKVKTFTDFSPNPVLKSVTPKPSESGPDDSINGSNELEKILNDIDHE